jgi:hypothetical protein
MAALGEVRRLRADDKLYRKINPGQYDGDETDPTAFVDKYENQSFFVDRLAIPGEILARFSRIRGVKRQCGTGDREPSLDEMFTAGYRIAEVAYQVFLNLGCRVVADEAGNEVTPDGHVNIADAKSRAPQLSRHARMLSREESVLG